MDNLQHHLSSLPFDKPDWLPICTEQRCPTPCLRSPKWQRSGRLRVLRLFCGSGTVEYVISGTSSDANPARTGLLLAYHQSCHPVRRAESIVARIWLLRLALLPD